MQRALLSGCLGAGGPPSVRPHLIGNGLDVMLMHSLALLCPSPARAPPQMIR